jgi:7-carboxy-7-deazaguanine synthase
LKVNEIFSSLQGEGSNIGKFATFVRFTGCNMDPKCSWCDTKYALTEGTEMSVEEIVQKVQKEYNGLVILTGAEPTIQKDFYRLIDVLNTSCYEVAVETNGLIYPQYDIFSSHYTVSPKPEFKIDENVLKLFNQKDMFSVEFKFVIGDLNSFIQATDLIKKLDLNPVVLQPLNGNLDKLKEIVQWVEAMKRADNSQYEFIRILPQLHKLIKVK